MWENHDWYYEDYKRNLNIIQERLLNSRRSVLLWLNMFKNLDDAVSHASRHMGFQATGKVTAGSAVLCAAAFLLRVSNQFKVSWVDNLELLCVFQSHSRIISWGQFSYIHLQQQCSLLQLQHSQHSSGFWEGNMSWTSHLSTSCSPGSNG